ncbi:peptidoglycan-binding protein LysM [Spirochaetia bacterium]|nr:peptidoglycan-binding protein LysM [Spirochaetia bacterium]
MTAVTVFAEDVTHTIQRGETIYSIARTYGVDMQEILSLNGIADAGKVQAGQRIKIPGAQSAPPALPELSAFIEHRVTRGETLYGISRQYGISYQTLRDSNNLSENYVLKAGDLLHIPGVSAPATVAATAPAANSVTAGSTGTSVVTTVPTGAGAGVRSTSSAAVDASIRWPVAAKEVFYMTGKLYGVALVGDQAEPVKSLTTGTVVSAGPYRGFGKVAIVEMTGGYLYVYGGCESLSVKEGDRVASGTELGRLGIDAVSTRPLLFFMVYKGNTPMDPAKAPRA